TFDHDGTLWAATIYGPQRLDLTLGFPGRWVRLKDIPIDAAILPLGPDPLAGNTGASTRRSLDGGYTWEEVYDRAGDDGPAEVPPGHPFAGRVLTGASQEIAYSADRAASFTRSVGPGQGGAEVAGAADFVSLPPGSSHPGRLLAAGRWGVTVSDDGGETYVESGLYRFLYYNGEQLGVVERPGGGYRVIAGGWINMQPYERVWVSEDGGETWGPDSAGGRRLEGPPFGGGGGVKGVLPLGSPSGVVVLGRGRRCRT